MKRAQLLLLIWGITVSAPPTWAEDESRIVEMTVRAGDTCEAIAERLYGSRHFYYVIHDYNRSATGDRSQCDASLQPGATLRLPVQAPREAEDPDAEVSAVLRQVTSRPPDSTTWGSAHPGQDLYRGWRVNTHNASEADLTFRDSSRLHLREHTLVIIFGPTSRRARKAGTKAVLERGALHSRLSELSGGVRVETPSATAELDQGEALVSVDQESTSRVANFAGKAATVSSKRGIGRVAVKAGMGSKVKRGGNPTPPRPLPQAPNWDANEPNLFVALSGHGAVVSGSWRSVEAAAAYRVAIATEPDGRGPAGSTGVPSKITQFELRGMRAGDYYLGVSTVDADRFESPSSTWRHVRVVEATLVTPGTLTSSDQDDLDAALEAPRVFAGSRVVAPQGFRCAVGEGTPAEEITLSEPGPASIRCLDDRGVEAARADVDIVQLRVAPVTSETSQAITASLPRGGTTTVSFEVRSDLPLPEELVAHGGSGITVEALSWQEEGVIELTLRAAADAPDSANLDLVAPAGATSVVLATLPISMVGPSTGASPAGDTTHDEEEPSRPTRNGELFAASESSWSTIGPNAFGVRDGHRSGVSLWVGAGYMGISQHTLENDHGLVAAGLQLGALRDRLRFDLGFSLGLRGAQPGARIGSRYRVIAHERLVLSVGLDAWLPILALEGDRYRARLIPSADLSARFGQRFLLRARQGAILDTDADRGLFWASAYGLDLWMVSLVSLSLEGVLLVGAEAGALVVAPYAGLGLALDFWNLVELDMGVQFATNDDARNLRGRFSFMATIRLIP